MERARRSPDDPGAGLPHSYQAAYQNRQLAAPSQSFLPTGKLGTALGQNKVEQTAASRIDTQLTDLQQRTQLAYNNALSSYGQVTQITPKDSNAWFQLAQAAQQSGDTAQAVKGYKRYLALNPDSSSKAQIQQLIQQLRRAPHRRPPRQEKVVSAPNLRLHLSDRGEIRMNFDIKTEQLTEENYVISLAGEVDLYTAPEFKQQLLEVIGQGGKHVVVDFSDTTFIDSTTLGVLVGGVKRLRSNDGQLSLVCSDRNITKIFEITGLDRVFTIYPTRDEAVAKLGSDGSGPPA